MLFIKKLTLYNFQNGINFVFNFCKHTKVKKKIAKYSNIKNITKRFD